MKGNIGVTSENIFPIIKKFLYSDHDIFLRELVSNAVDATQKLRTLAARGEVKGEIGETCVKVSLDKDAKTLTISDQGIGMTADEIDRYINQIAFSGAGEFLEKYKDDAAAIIGHFGLGFYSAFMVAEKVEILTQSYQEGAKAVRWTCDGSPEYTLEEDARAERGTDIILHISEDCAEFLEEGRISSLLQKYCRFLPVEIYFKDEKVNDTTPLWTRKPTEVSEEDYKKFYRDLFPISEEPLFWIHLNVDFPFHLTGVLYFPHIRVGQPVKENKIQLYCNQVFVTDEVESIVPQYLTLLHGVIDSPDIPLNVSRSYLQSDANVKKISSYITKKVCDRLTAIMKEDRAEYEKKWDDLRLFTSFGMLSDDDFYPRAEKSFYLLKDVAGKHYTIEEYRTLVASEQTDKDGTLILLYATSRDEQYSYIAAAENKGYNVLLMDGELDAALLSRLEQKLEKVRALRVDADTPERLIVKDDEKPVEVNPEEASLLSTSFETQMPQGGKETFHVSVEHLGAEGDPLLLTRDEYMRRMKEMAALQGGAMSFYGEMPDMYQVRLNADHPLIAALLKAETDAEGELSKTLSPIDADVRGLEARVAALSQKKTEDEAEKEQIRKDTDEARKQLEARRDERRAAIAAEAAKHPVIARLISLALLRAGLLRGKALEDFVSAEFKNIKE